MNIYNYEYHDNSWDSNVSTIKVKIVKLNLKFLKNIQKGLFITNLMNSYKTRFLTYV